MFVVLMLLTSPVPGAQKTTGLSATELGEEVDLPPAQRWRAGFPVVRTEVERAFQELGLVLDESVTAQGKIVSQFKEYISGITTAVHLDRIAVRPKLSGGSWVRVRYRTEIELEPIQKNETLARGSANIEALQRDFRGKEEWIQLPSRGVLEEEILTRIGQNLFGQRYQIDWPKKRGYWDRSPQAVPEAGTPRDPLPKPDREKPAKRPTGHQ